MDKPFRIEGKGEASNKTVRLPNELINRLEKVASEKNLSFSAIVLQCCEYALENLED